MTHFYNLKGEKEKKGRRKNPCVAWASCCVVIMSSGKGGFNSGGTRGCEKDVRGLERAWESRAVHGVGRSRGERVRLVKIT